MKADFSEQVGKLIVDIEKLDDSYTETEIDQVAKRLEGLNFSPPVVTPLSQFLRLNKQGLLQEVKRILDMPEAEACSLAPGDSKKCDDLRLQYISVIVFYYKKLLKLRAGDLEEWDEVDELCVHD